MQRTQLLLDDWQYEALKAQAERQGRSMSELLREMLDSALARDGAGGRGLALDDIRGIGEDRSARGRNHDDFLYSKRGRR
jgi:plasmid stability protein